jgi:hypothetical protein
MLENMESGICIQDKKLIALPNVLHYYFSALSQRGIVHFTVN